jgi:mono/diheme cytochrome c family protein
MGIERRPALRTTALALALALAAAGCERQMNDMYRQPRADTYGGSDLFPDGRAARPTVAGTTAHARGVIAGTSSGRRGDDPAGLLAAAGPAAASNPYPVTAALLRRGRERFDIYCAPCHGAAGDGDGLLPRRGFPRPPSYHSARLRAVPDGYIYTVITSGYGRMYPYANRVPPADRWAIVAYIRALQLSQHASLADVPAPERRALEGQPR